MNVNEKDGDEEDGSAPGSSSVGRPDVGQFFPSSIQQMFISFHCE